MEAAASSDLSSCVMASGCHTKHHTLGGLSHRNSSSQFWSPDVWNQGVGRALLPQKAPGVRPSLSPRLWCGRKFLGLFGL